jgi:hypothetical protein
MVEMNVRASMIHSKPHQSDLVQGNTEASHVAIA